MKKERLLILGASVRAAAQSAAAAGYEVIAADQFADRDLREICPDARPVKYPEGLLEFAMAVEPCAWMYTGALENYPEIVAKISERHELLGNGAEVLRRVRDPLQLWNFAQRHGFSYPHTQISTPTSDKKWLIKRIASGGGLGVRIATPASRLARGEVFQEFVEGIAGSLTYLAADGSVDYLYSSVQLHDLPFLAAPRFHYAGGITAIRWDLGSYPTWNTQIINLGGSLAAEFELRGVFGVDLILKDEEIWILEVNPRYTASMGLFERYFEAPLVDRHVLASRACAPKYIWPPMWCTNYRASAILYAQMDGLVTDRMSDRLWAMRGELDLADLPMGGSAIGKGHPVLTIFAEGNSREETIRSLEAKVNQLRALGIP